MKNSLLHEEIFIGLSGHLNGTDLLASSPASAGLYAKIGAF